MPWPRSIAVLVVLSCGVLGCGKKKRISRKGPAVVTLHSAGAEPRVALRYRFKAGETLAYRMTSRRRITGLPSPDEPVTIHLSAFTDRVRKRRARLRWRVDRVLSGSPRLQGLALWVETSDRGEISTVSRGRPAPQKSSLRESVGQLFLAWPEAAVGPGARWTQRRDLILSPATGGGFRAKVEARYRFERIAPCGQGRCAHLSVRTTLLLTHKAGRVRVQGKGTGTGRVVFDLRRGRLLESHTRAEIGLSTSLAPNQVIQKIFLKQSMELRR